MIPHHGEDDEEVIPSDHSDDAKTSEELDDYCQKSSSCRDPCDNEDFLLPILIQIHGLSRHILKASREKREACKRTRACYVDVRFCQTCVKQ